MNTVLIEAYIYAIEIQWKPQLFRTEIKKDSLVLKIIVVLMCVK